MTPLVVAFTLVTLVAFVLASLPVRETNERALERVAEHIARGFIGGAALVLAVAGIMSDAARAFPSSLRWHYRRFVPKKEKALETER